MISVKTDRLVERSTIFYGWIVWAAATLGTVASSPGQSFAVSLFFDHFIADLGLTRTTVSALYSAGTLLSALALTYVGRTIDRVGNRRAGAVISLGLALALGLLSLVQGPVLLLVGFLLIRGLGQGSLTLNSSNVIARWFRRRRGSAMAITSFIFTLSQGAIVTGLTLLIDAIGWRSSLRVEALVVGLVVLPLLAIFLRDRPEAFGLEPDGDTVIEPDALDPADAPPVEAAYTLRQAMRTPIFWVCLLIPTLNAAMVTGVIIHQISLFEVVGHGPEVAVQTFSLAATVAAVVTLIAGPLTNRVRPQWMAAAQMLLLGAAMALAPIMVNRPLTIAYGLAMGGLMGIWPVFNGVIWPNLYGRKHDGEIRGLSQTTAVAGSAAAPILFSLSFDAGGNYNIALWAGVGIAAAIFVASLLVKVPPLLPDGDQAEAASSSKSH